MAAPRVLAVLVAHASGTWLSDALASLRLQGSDALDVVVVAVGELTLPPGRGRPPVVEAPAGTAYPAAVALALAAHGDDAEFVLLLHDDVALAPGALEAMLARMDGDTAAVGAKLVEWDEPDVIQEVGATVDRFATRRTGLEEREVDHGQHDDADDVLFASSACLLVRRADLAAVGGLDAGAWPLYDDVDLCWRLRAAGRRVRVEPQARVRHVAATSRGTRRAGGPAFGALALRTRAEHGRLRFMLKNYERTTLIAILPQYAVLALWRLAVGLVRREFWSVRCQLSAWLQVARELPRLVEVRRRAPARPVGDDELLHLAARRAIVERRYRWLSAGAGVVDTAERVERRARSLLRDPLTWAWAGALVVVVITLRGVLFGGAFTLGELRPIPTLGDAISAFAARVRPEGLAAYGPAGPGIVFISLPRAFGLSASLAQKIVLIGPLIAAAIGANRLARIVGLRGRGARWLEIGAAVNPVTLALLRRGSVGALVVWAASMWIGSAMLGPAEEPAGPGDRLRRRSRWVLGWLAVVSVHPSGIVWLAALGAVLASALGGDGLGRRRWTMLGVGVAGALVAGAPWSMDWFTSHTPLIGRAAGTLPGGPGGMGGATFGVGWPLAALAAVAVLGAYAVGLTRTSLALTALSAASWGAAALGLVPGHTALVGVGWSSIALLALAWRRVSDELPTYELGIRHALVVGTVAAVALVWAGAALGSLSASTPARTLEVVATGDEPTGRVLWIDGSDADPMFWATQGFHEPLRAFPRAGGPEDRLVAGGLWAARAGRTHRLGAVLALNDISHVIALTPSARTGLDRQADLAPAEQQSGAIVYRNDAWSGPAALLAAPPGDVLTAQGLADLVRERRPLRSTSTPGHITVEIPGGSDGIVYLSGAARRGWDVPGAGARIAAGGVWLPTAGTEGSIDATPPGGPLRWLLVPQLIIVLGLVLAWAGAVYLAGPATSPSGPAVATDLRTPPGMPLSRWAPVLMIAFGVGWLGWAVPRVVRADTFLSAAWYCPPAGEDFTQRLAIANPTSGEATYLVRVGLDEPPLRSGTLGPLDRATVEVDAQRGALVETYGVRVVVGAEVGLRGRKGASGLCAQAPRGTYHFAEGGRAATRARPRLFERYVIYNPFTELARASVRFLPDATEADKDAVSPPTLQDVRVEPGQTVIVDPEEVFFFPLRLSAQVEVWQGRAVVGHRLHTSEEVYWSLGTDLVRSGVLHRASTLRALTRIVAFDPAQRPATVRVTGSGEEGSLPELEFDVPETRRATFDLNDDVPDLPDLVVSVTADRPLAFETLVVRDDRVNISVMPLLEPARRWTIPAAEGRRLVVSNPNPQPVRLRLTRLGSGGPIADATVGAGRALVLDLEGERPFGLLVTSDGGPVTAVAVGGAGSMSGFPVR